MLRKSMTMACLLALAACAPAPQRPVPPAPGPAEPPAPAAQPPAPPEPAPASVKVNPYQQRIIQETNAFRAENRLAPLAPDLRLLQIAQAHAANMARQDKYGDTDRNGHVLDGRNLEYRIGAGGYEYARVAENVAYQLNKADDVGSAMAGWKASPGHRRNMLLPDVTQIGVGAARGKSGRWYFVQLFGRPADPPVKARRQG